jgi:hypothetical protein
MSITLEDTKFALDSHAPEGKLWGRLLIAVNDTDTGTQRSIQLEVLLDRKDKSGFSDYENTARVEAKKFLKQVAEKL